MNGPELRVTEPSLLERIHFFPNRETALSSSLIELTQRQPLSTSLESAGGPLAAAERSLSAPNLPQLFHEGTMDSRKPYDFGLFTLRDYNFSKLDKFREHMAEFGNLQGLQYNAFLEGLHDANPRLHERPDLLRGVLENRVDGFARAQINEAQAYARDNSLGAVEENTDRSAWTDRNVEHLTACLKELAAGEPHGASSSSGFVWKSWHVGTIVVGAAALSGGGVWTLDHLLEGERPAGQADNETVETKLGQGSDPDPQHELPCSPEW